MTQKQPQGQSNAKLALVLGSIALVFFLGVIAKHWLFRG
jgi:hypothetical protein